MSSMPPPAGLSFFSFNSVMANALLDGGTAGVKGVLDAGLLLLHLDLGRGADD